VIEVFADIWCPFAYVGLQIVRVERDRLAPGAEVRTRAWPLELVNGAPMNVDKTANHIHELRAQLGINLFNGFAPESFPTTTIPALALVHAADVAGKGEEADSLIRHALWEEGRNIGAPEVVGTLAAALGVTVGEADTQSVIVDWHEGERRGVKGSPHFFCGDRNEFCPSLSLSRDDEGELHIKPNPERLLVFLGECWG
jgi:predicted DsbA family dithiol-disulfide isomerase